MIYVSSHYFGGVGSGREKRNVSNAREFPDSNLIALIFSGTPFDRLKNSGPLFKHNIKIWQMKVSYFSQRRPPLPTTLVLTFQGTLCSTKKHLRAPNFLLQKGLTFEKSVSFSRHGTNVTLTNLFQLIPNNIQEKISPF